jgi:hypothetical protein
MSARRSLARERKGSVLERNTHARRSLACAWTSSDVRKTFSSSSVDERTMLDRMSESMRDDECTMSVHRAVASKSDDERKAVAGMSDDERKAFSSKGA